MIHAKLPPRHTVKFEDLTRLADQQTATFNAKIDMIEGLRKKAKEFDRQITELVRNRTDCYDASRALQMLLAKDMGHEVKQT